MTQGTKDKKTTMILSLLYLKRNLEQPSMSILEISTKLEAKKLKISTKHVNRILNEKLKEVESSITKDGDTGYWPKYSGLKKMDITKTRKMGFNDRSQRWYWEKTQTLYFDVPMDHTTALTFKLLESHMSDNLQIILGGLDLESHYHNADSHLNELSKGNHKVQFSKKIKTVTLPHDDFTHTYEDEKAPGIIYNTLLNNNVFEADYLRSSYDYELNDIGKWKKKGVLARGKILRAEAKPYHNYLFSPIGILFRGPACFVIAYMRESGDSGKTSWAPQRFALHKFRNVKEIDRDHVENFLQNFDLEWYVTSEKMDTVVDQDRTKSLIPLSIDLEIYVSEAVAEHLDETKSYGLELRGMYRKDLKDRGITPRTNWRLFTGEVKDSEQLRRWLLSLKEVEVILPIELRDEFQRIANTTLSYYTNNDQH